MTAFNSPTTETRPVSKWSKLELCVERNHLLTAVRRDPCTYNKDALNTVLDELKKRESV